MAKRLVIVESPAKARTIAGYLGDDYAVGSSVGHVARPSGSREGRSGGQRKRFGALGVDVDRASSRTTSSIPARRRSLTTSRSCLADADELLLATDEDREGEAIAWHLVEVLKPKVPVRRMVFHEITKDAITRALDDTRGIDDRPRRRAGDAPDPRSPYGYEVSPVLWKKVMQRLSAGRVQSVATRLVVERERERMAFRSADYWDLLATFDPGRVRGATRVGRRQPESPRARTSRRRRASCARATSSSSTRMPRLAGRASRRRDRSRSARSTTGRIAASRPRRSARRPCSRRRAGSCASRRRRRCASPSASTSRATSRTCGRTPRRYPSRRSTAARAQVASSSARTSSPPSRGSTAARSRTRRRRTRRSAPPGDSFRTPKELQRRARARRARALRPRVETNARVADGGRARARPSRCGSARRARGGEDAEFGASGTVITFRGFLAAYEPGKDEPTDDDEERVLPQLRWVRTSTLLTLEPDGHAT